MQNYIKLVAEAASRVIVFGNKDDVTFQPKEVSLFTLVGAGWTALQAAGTSQADGGRGFREGTKERRFARKDLRDAMRDISEIAKAIDEEGVDVGMAERFRLPPHSLNYIAMAMVARAFAEAAEPRKALFIERGLAVTFVEDLSALIALVEGAADTREEGRGAQVGGTSALESVARDTLRHIRQLRSILRVRLRDNPALLAEWMTAARVHSAGSSAPAATPPPGDGGSTPPGDGGSGS